MGTDLREKNLKDLTFSISGTTLTNIIREGTLIMKNLKVYKIIPPPPR
ncbi:hypothetical protein PilKf_01428 [Pillotina sp. SPG140]|jgi:hypothetical protein